jgi:hypothetical protein
MNDMTLYISYTEVGNLGYYITMNFMGYTYYVVLLG